MTDRSGPRLRVAARLPDTGAEGPFLRYALWLQGCPLRCPGCCNPAMLSPEGGLELAVEDLLGEVRAAPGIEGVTLLGGEPFAQAGPLAAFARGVRAEGLGVIAFSGFTLGELRGAGPDAAALLAELDLLVDGRWEAGRASSHRRWIGSDNQRVHFFTGRYRGLDDGRGGLGEGEGTVEVRVSRGRVVLSGAPDPRLAAVLLAAAGPEGASRSGAEPL